MQSPTLIPESEARRRVLASVPQMGSEAVPLAEALGRVLCEDIASGVDLPRYANASMDGFALRDRDTRDAAPGSPVELRLVGESAAGSPFAAALETPGTAVRIMTGAIVPDGANSVLELEKVKEQEGVIVLTVPSERGRNIRLPGEDVRKGENVIRRGTILQPSHIGLLASLGQVDVGVSLRPSIALITTGSELVDVTEDLAPGQVRNSSAHMLPAYVRQCGARIATSVTLGDDSGLLHEALKKAFDADAVITTGGISVGKYDLVRKSLTDLEVDMRVSGVNMKPGKPFAFGVAPNSTPVFCLPGNPVSTVVTYLRFVYPALMKMMGAESELRSMFSAVLEHDIHKKDTRSHFLRGILRRGAGIPTVRLTGNQSSGVLSSIARANCFIILPPEPKTYHSGEHVEIQLL